jgi:hypothetical protein
MLEINLFYEQQENQLAKDYDPVKLTIAGGVLLFSVIALWGAFLYFNMGPLRGKLTSAKKEVQELDKKLKDLGELTDLPKIKGEAQALHHRILYRPLLASQLDVFRTLIPTNCQMRFLRTSRSIAIEATSVPTKPGKPPITTRRSFPTMEVIIEINTKAKSKANVLEIRDSLLEKFQKDERLKQFVRQAPPREGETETLNEVAITSSKAQDAMGGELAVGVFELKFFVALKDPPLEETL